MHLRHVFAVDPVPKPEPEGQLRQSFIVPARQLLHVISQFLQKEVGSVYWLVPHFKHVLAVVPEPNPEPDGQLVQSFIVPALHDLHVLAQF